MTGDQLAAGEHIFHIATVDDWQAALLAGDYRVSTLGGSLADEGFIHASRSRSGRRCPGRLYADPGLRLVLLEIDPAALEVELRLEVPPGAEAAFPHIYGPLPIDAVVAVRELG